MMQAVVFSAQVGHSLSQTQVMTQYRYLFLSAGLLVVFMNAVADTEKDDKTKVTDHKGENFSTNQEDQLRPISDISMKQRRHIRSIISFCQTQECLKLLLQLERQLNNQSMGVYSGRW